ncbi:MAG: flagellar hook-associated protein FlgK [Proteobacteria bacterium]|nr:flagellar hook-associated protein FlgK [Pseudomonadota bacterium]
MVDILKMGASSLLSIQRALSTTGHNIVNVNTEGFSRQTVHFGTADPQRLGFGFIGQGSEIQSIERSYNKFLSTQVRDFTASQSRAEVFAEFSSRVDNILADSEHSLSASLQNFFSAVADVAANPSTLPERQVLIGEANNLVDRQQSFNNLLQNLNSEVNSELRLTVTEINGLADSISQLNKQIVSANSSGSRSPPNDLLDQRDRLLQQLSRQISVTTHAQSDGALNIFIGKGQALVVGSQSTHLQTQFNSFDSSRLEIGIAGQINVNGGSQFVSGGKLQGLLDFRSRVLLPAQAQLGLVTLGLTEKVNAQHRVGMDLNGAMGGSFFESGTISIAGSVNNTGSAIPNATLNDVSSIRATDYSLVYDGSQWQLTRLSDNTSVVGSGPLILDGLSIDVSVGLAATGDSFILNPARTAAANFTLAISDPRKIAAAAAVITNATLTNAGTSVLSELTVAAANTLPLAGPVTLTFNPDALGAGVPGFDVVGGPGGTLAYDPATESAGKTFTLAAIGLSFKISDVPQSGDSFVIENNIGGVGDNRNLLKMGELQHQKVLNGAKDSFQEFYGALVAQVGVTNRQGSANLVVETVLLQQAEGYRDSASGVNLDEEAANLLRYQQAYQASAQLIKIADQLFQTLLNSIG